MSCPSLRNLFGDDFSSSAFQTIDGEQRIVGKWGQITQFEDGSFDVWFVGPDLTPLTRRKLGVIARNFPEEEGFTEVTGEAWAQGQGQDFVLRAARLAGVKRKRRLSAEAAAEAREQLATARVAGKGSRASKSEVEAP